MRVTEEVLSKVYSDVSVLALVGVDGLTDRRLNDALYDMYSEASQAVISEYHKRLDKVQAMARALCEAVDDLYAFADGGYEDYVFESPDMPYVPSPEEEAIMAQIMENEYGYI